MFVSDIEDKDLLHDLLAEVEDRLLDDPANEQAMWDREDILDRLAELSPKLYRLFSRPSPFAEDN